MDMVADLNFAIGQRVFLVDICWIEEPDAPERLAKLSVLCICIRFEADDGLFSRLGSNFLRSLHGNVVEEEGLKRCEGTFGRGLDRRFHHKLIALYRIALTRLHRKYYVLLRLKSIKKPSRRGSGRLGLVAGSSVNFFEMREKQEGGNSGWRAEVYGSVSILKCLCIEYDKSNVRP
jgi:hypothetical protein